MKKLAGTLFLLISSQHLFAQWVELEDFSTASVTRAFVSDSAMLYAGTDGGGVFKTTDLGQTWTPASEGITDPIVQSLAGTGTNLFAGTLDGSIFHSTDQGESWTALTTDIPPVPITALLIHGTSIYAASAAGIYASTDNGNTWVQKDTMHVVSLGANGSTLFAGAINQGVFRSTDNGTTWNKVLPEIPEPTAFAASGSTVFVSSYSQGVLRSTDDGLTWTPINFGFAENAHPGFFATANNDVFVGSEGQGIYLLKNGDTTWTQLSGLPPQMYVYALAIHDGNIFADGFFYLLRRPLGELLSVKTHDHSTALTHTIPNPASRTTTVRFSLTKPSFVQLTIVDVLGRRVADLASQIFPEGDHSVLWDVSEMPKGTYYCRLQSEDNVESRTIVVIK